MQLISSNLLPIPIAAGQDGSGSSSVEFGLEYCPSMDLIAVYPKHIVGSQANPNSEFAQPDPVAENIYGYEEDEELNVDVYRLNGQKVFTATIEIESKETGIVGVAWREDGIILAISTSDNRIRLVNTFSGKIVHTFTSISAQSSPVSRRTSGFKNDSSARSGKRKSLTQGGNSRKRLCLPLFMHYSTHLANPDSNRSRLAEVHKENGRVLDDLLGLHADVDELLKLEADLPKELAGIDVEQSLPKLATIPTGAIGDNAVFSTRTSIDSLLHATKQSTKSSGTDIVTIARDNAKIHVRIFDSFEVGDSDLNSALRLPSGCVLDSARSIVTHPFEEKIFVLASEEADGNSTRSKKQNMSDVAGNNGLHLLSLDLRFLQQSRLGLPVLATKATQLHNLARYLRQIEQQLTREAKSAFDLPSRFIRTLEEDLKEQDGEGSTFQTSSYHALVTGEVTGKFKEWLVDILGDRGVKRWEKAVFECLETARRLMNENWMPAVERAGVVVSRLMGLAASSAFSVDKTILDGLRDTIDVMAIVGEDLIREVNMEINGFSAFIAWLKREVEAAGLEDTSEKLEEMRENSNHSDVRKVMKYVSERVQDTAVKTYIRDEPVVEADTDNDLTFYKDFCETRRSTKKAYTPPTIRNLTGRIRTQCDLLFRQVAQQLEENVVVEHICRVNGPWDAEVLACRIIHQQNHAVLITLTTDPDNEGTLYMAQKSLDEAKGDTQMTNIALDDVLAILDIKFLEDETGLVLVRGKDSVKVLSLSLHDGLEVDATPRHVFGGVNDNFTKLGLSPWKMNVNGRKGRRTMTILDRLGRGYGVFDLDSSEGDASDDDEAMRG